jgi:predicted O-methyltransferase YrrM
MQPAKLDVLVALLSYGGNGGVASVVPTHVPWFSKLFSELNQDNRIGKIAIKQFGDIPLSMERNRIVKTAKQGGFDVILMIDSDNVPDLYLGHKPWAKPFWKTSFDFLYERHMRGLPTVVCAPYCGPPPHPVNGGEENVYVFYAENFETDGTQPHFKFAAYTRNHAAQMRGIQEIAAGPTGVILYSTDAFDLMPIRKLTPAEILDHYKAGRLTQERAVQLLDLKSWFFYEYTDAERSAKASTEDVTNTREIQMAGLLKHKESVVFCNWDAWAGHFKPKCVGMPEPIYIENVSQLYQEAVAENLSLLDEDREIDFTGDEDDFDEPVEEEESLPAHIANPAITSRMLFGRKVTNVVNRTAENDLQALKNLVDYLAHRFKDRALRVIEVGSWVGESAIALQAGFGAAGGTVFCIDHFEGSQHDYLGEVAKVVTSDMLRKTFFDNIGELNGTRIKLIEGKSLEIADKMAPQEADLVFIDAEHNYESVALDIEAWLPHVSDNGFLVGHDYCDAFPGVKQAVDEFMAAANLETRLITGTELWVCQVGPYRKALQAVQERAMKEEPVGA